jgi:hypothetical protein
VGDAHEELVAADAGLDHERPGIPRGSASGRTKLPHASENASATAAWTSADAPLARANRRSSLRSGPIVSGAAGTIRS